MSQAAIALREENRDGIKIRTSGANSNMVTNIKDHITCTRSMENYSSPDPKVGIVSFPCDFDHMYASMSEGMVSSKEKNEYKYLKEICLQHLDLIQQQSELIAKQEKQIQSLRQEKDRLKQRLQRMDRRAGHLKANCDTDAAEAKSSRANTPTNRRHRSPLIVSSDAIKGPRNRSARSFSPQERSRSPAHWRRSSAQRRQSEDGVSVSSECEMHDDSSTTTVSQRSTLRGKRTVAPMRKRQRGKRSLSSGSRETNTNKEVQQEGSVSEGHPSKRAKTEEEDPISGGEICQSNDVLTTNHPYYTATGSSEPGWALGEMCIETEPEQELNGEVLETPQWRVKVYTSLYSMEGTENLDDEVFLKRHHRLEVDERRRKRWDVQRIREQRHIEKLKQREASSALAGSSKGDGPSEEPVCTLWPTPDDAQYLQVADELPVSAFGLPITKFTPRPGSLEETKATGKKTIRSRRSTISSTAGRKRIVRRGGSRGSLHHTGRRGEVAERK